MISISKFSNENQRFLNILKRQQDIPVDVINTVSSVIEDIKQNGDVALKKYMMKYDDVDIDKIGLMVTEEEINEAKKNISSEFAEAIKNACDNIIKFHKKQMPSGYIVDYENNVKLERKYIPLKRIAVTVPGDMAPLLSTLYMNIIPAIVAGVPDINIISKPKDGKINDYLLFVADYLNINSIYKISGSQGIAAMAYGTESIEKVDAIVGPGNNYTQMAKKLLYGVIKVDSIAGPSEIAIIADDNANSKFIAADLLSQSEHGTGYEASVVFCSSWNQAKDIKNELEKLVQEYKLDNTKKSLENYGNIFIVDNINQAIDAVNDFAPEHVEVLVKDSNPVVDCITNAGAIFVGEYTPETVGDYFCGTNHVLPTCGTARFSSGLSVLDFMRGFSIINYTKSALQENASQIGELVIPEGLKAHKLAVDIRLKNNE